VAAARLCIISLKIKTEFAQYVYSCVPYDIRSKRRI